MNFKTTFILLIALAIVGAFIFFLPDDNPRDGGGSSDSSASAGEGRKLIDATANDITKVVVAPKNGPRMAFERSGIEWRIVEPVKAGAESFAVDSLAREIADLRTTQQIDVKGKESSTGLDQPQYRVEVTTRAGGVQKLAVGSKSAVGNILYVRLNDAVQADVVNASLVDQLEKPLSTYREAGLLDDVRQDQIQSVSVKQGDKTLKMTKAGADWKIVEPKEMPGDSSEVSNLLFAITGLRAEEFVAEDASKAAAYGLDNPAMTVAFTTTPPATGPSTSPAATKAATAPASQPSGTTTTIRFGRHADVLMKNVFAMASDAGPIVKVPTSTLESFKKSPLDLRDRRVLDVDPEKVNRITIGIDRPATTQPTAKPAEKREVVLERRLEKLELGPAAPAPEAPQTPPSSAPKPEQKKGEKSDAGQPPGGATVTLASYQEAPAEAAKPEVAPKPAETEKAQKTAKPPATLDAAPAGPASAPAPGSPATAPERPTTAPEVTPPPLSKWVIASDAKTEVDDMKVDALLQLLHPLRAQKYVASAPTTQPAPNYVLTLQLQGPEHQIQFTDSGVAGNVIGKYNDLTFEVDRAIIDKLTGGFDKKPAEPPVPGAPFS